LATSPLFIFNAHNNLYCCVITGGYFFRVGAAAGLFWFVGVAAGFLGFFGIAAGLFGAGHGVGSSAVCFKYLSIYLAKYNSAFQRARYSQFPTSFRPFRGESNVEPEM
jgi:hypothetical protein